VGNAKQTAPEVAVAERFWAKQDQPRCEKSASDCPGGQAEKEATAKQAVHTFREVRQPIERDDDETRQLLRLSQLEGRDPLQDAVAGRLALDRLDAVADGDVDTNKARWADELRRELRERFNDIAPTKFEVPR